jgi:hypothetical protein
MKSLCRRGDSHLAFLWPFRHLALVELKNECKAEIDAVWAQVRERYADYMIGTAAGHAWRIRHLGRLQSKRNFAVVA